MAPSWAQAASPDFNRPPRAANADVEKIEARRKVLFQQMLDKPGNLDVAFEYAALSSQVGDLEGAIATLERMLIFAPGLPRLQLELGVLYFRLGAYATAETYFKAAASGTNVPPKVRDKVNEYLEAIERNTQTSVFAGSVTTGLRYQSNANSGPSSQFVTLNGLDYVLSDNARKTADTNGFLTGDFTALFDLPGQGEKFKVNLRTYAEAYRDRHDLNLAYAELAAGPSFDLNRFGWEGYSLDLYGIAGGGILSGDPLTSVLGAGALLGVRASDDVFYGLRSEYRHETYYNSADHPRLDEKTGDRFQAQLLSTFRLTSSLSLGVSGIIDRFDADVGSNAYWQYAAVVGASIDFDSPIVALPGLWNFGVSTQVSQRHYDDADPMISSETQSTTKWSINVTQTIPLDKTWAAQIQASYQKSWSNYDTSEFDNATISLGLKKVF